MLVISEAFGLHAHIADVAQRFARQGDPIRCNNVGKLLKELLRKIPDPQVM